MRWGKAQFLLSPTLPKVTSGSQCRYPRPAIWGYIREDDKGLKRKQLTLRSVLDNVEGLVDDGALPLDLEETT
jgi:hypothetical protein